MPVMVRLAATEVERIDAERGDRSRSDYVRSALNPSSGGAGIQPTPAGPTDEAPISSLSAPPDPPDPEEIIEREMCKFLPLPGGGKVGPGTLTERPPSDRQLAARVVTAMQNVDPTDAGPLLTPEEATFLRQWAQRTLDAWKAKHAPPAPAEKPQRRQWAVARPQAAVIAGRAVERLNGTAGRPQAPVPVSSPRQGKRHAVDCSCLSCKAPKVVAK